MRDPGADHKGASRATATRRQWVRKSAPATRQVFNGRFEAAETPTIVIRQLDATTPRRRNDAATPQRRRDAAATLVIRQVDASMCDSDDSFSITLPCPLVPAITAILLLLALLWYKLYVFSTFVRLQLD
jgi:hypothetical protein